MSNLSKTYGQKRNQGLDRNGAADELHCKQKCRQKYTSTTINLKTDKNKSYREILHLFSSFSCSPGDLAAKGQGENKGEQRAVYV